MVAVYIVGPVVWGMVVNGESRGWKKLIGIVACLAATIMLGLASPDVDPVPSPAASPSPAPGNVSSATATPLPPTPAAAVGADDGEWAIKTLFYLAAIGAWGVSDGVSAYVQKPAPEETSVAAVEASGAGATSAASPPPPRSRGPLQLPSIIALTAGGFMCAAAVCGALSLALRGQYPPPPPSALTPAAAALPACSSPLDGGGSYGLFFLAQTLGKAAWFSVVQLGGLSEASSFIPLVSLDVFVPSLLGVALLGERLAAVGWVGLVLAVVGVGLVSTSA